MRHFRRFGAPTLGSVGRWSPKKKGSQVNQTRRCGVYVVWRKLRFGGTGP